MERSGSVSDIADGSDVAETMMAELTTDRVAAAEIIEQPGF
jgi:hypothetical protein